ncbi:VacJ family lipoprotein [Candidatus Njordibacter sp. Uisw_039]|jgi:phospholipid-binding lipoprotein MlaA|uniref:MlaA family lipoprotein n=1 Tax=Candidatus Njordibacter sp. Uisw_039 TaxID=3230972 RepID=UPI003D464C7A|tara:strand:- start:2194 stop:2916 length:723 start_codon:yes stop_codon:yes gene_type:complete
MLGRLKIGLILSLVLLTACSSVPNGASIETQSDPRDPFQNLNRKVHAFNNVVDKKLLMPVVNVYASVTPDSLEKGIGNFFSNLSEVGNFLNHTLQFKPLKAAKDLGRLVINTTLGLGGIIDVASDLGIYQESEDFGQTLGFWGVSPGPYVVLPFLGPSTLRDTGAIIINPSPNPIDRYNPAADRLYISALQVVDLRRQLGDFDSLVSGDPYIFIREAYLQRREHLIKDGIPSDDDGFDDF